VLTQNAAVHDENLKCNLQKLYFFRRNKMSNNNWITKGAIAAAVTTVFGASAVTAETINSTATVDIITGFTFVETSPINFGDIAVLNTIGAADVTVVMNETSGTRTTSDATEVALLAGGGETRLVLDASAAPPFTAMAVTIPETAALTVGTNPDIIMSALTEDGGGLTTDAGGALNLTYGATLVFSNGETYGAGTYTGPFSVTLDFP
jgi:hypothetical protein